MNSKKLPASSTTWQRGYTRAMRRSSNGSRTERTNLAKRSRISKPCMQGVQSQAEELAESNRTLETRVAEQVDAVERAGQLRRFLSPQLADAILQQGGSDILESHRREITVVFCDLRGFTGFSQTVEPEDVMQLLADYHAALGGLIHKHEGTLERFLGDGLMVLFNDPVPCPNPAERAVRMAVGMRALVGEVTDGWTKGGV